jgi:TPR repeat protein
VFLSTSFDASSKYACPLGERGLLTVFAASTASSASAPQADVYAQGMEAYKNGNYKEAHDLFKKAATAGNAEACYQLGLMLSTGKGTIAKNTLQAKVWMKKAAGLGHAEAQKVLETL